MVRLIKSDGTVINMKPAKGTKFTYEEISQHVGAYFTCLPLPGGRRFVVTEDAELRGFPFNNVATSLSYYGVPLFGDVMHFDRSAAIRQFGKKPC